MTTTALAPLTAPLAPPAHKKSMKSASPLDRHYTTGEIAKLLQVAPRTVSKWFDSGRLAGFRIPGSNDRRIPGKNVIAFLKAHGFPLPPDLVAPTTVLLYGLSGSVPEVAQFLPAPDAFTFGVLAATERLAGAVIGDSESLAVAIRAAQLLRERQPDARIVFALSLDVPGEAATALAAAGLADCPVVERTAARERAPELLAG